MIVKHWLYVEDMGKSVPYLFFFISSRKNKSIKKNLFLQFIFIFYDVYTIQTCSLRTEPSFLRIKTFFTVRHFLYLLLELLLWLNFLNIVTKFTGYMEHWINMNPWKNQTDGINSFDFLRKIEGSVLNEQVCMRLSIAL